MSQHGEKRAVYEEHRLVRAEEIDRLGHVNNLAYLGWAIEAAVRHSVVNGWPFERYQEIGGGWVVRTHRITYLRPARVGQTVRLRTWITDFSRATCKRVYQMDRIEAETITPLVEAETEWVFVDFARQLPRRIPREVLDAFVIIPVDSESR